MFNDGSNIVMPVAPAYGGYGNGNGFFGDGDFGGFILGLLFGGLGGWGGFGGFGGGWGGMMGWEAMFPYFFNTQTQNDVNRGFDNLGLSNQISSLQGSIDSVRTDSKLSDIQNAINSGFASAEVANCGRAMDAMQTQYQNEIATLERSFASQQAMNQGFNDIGLQLCQASGDNRLATANLGADIAREACATRTSDTQNTQLILNAINDGFRQMNEYRFQDKIDAKNDEIAQLRQENLYARGQASQIAQNSTIIDGVYNRLATCPVDTTPVFGRTPIFTCATNVAGGNNCPCGNNYFG